MLMFLLLMFLSPPSRSSHTIATEAKDSLPPSARYMVQKKVGRIHIDGRGDEPAWSRVPWTGWFTDIVSGERKDNVHGARCKMLWDKRHLYVLVELQDPDLWASIERHDEMVFQDNALEMFLDPDGDARNYFEFQINGFGTTCDLEMPKPYYKGGKAHLQWEMKGLKSAVRLLGTLNNPPDRDTGWYVEMAVPFGALHQGMQHRPQKGTVWRMNFSSVTWKLDVQNGRYVRRNDCKECPPAEHYQVWSTQGMINLHHPERWGQVRFED